ncbi:MAG TPA: DUF5060 domain-containing protein [Deinococcales bacterium]|nr:DUF5060 domain-containing protein [Deinococcales bacterium]
MRSRGILPALALAATLAACNTSAPPLDPTPTTEAPIEVPIAPDSATYQAKELRFSAPAPQGNPFTTVSFSAEFRGPSGQTLAVPGFHDGGSAWAVRFAAPAPGKWTYATRSNLAALDGKQGSLLVGPAGGRHGGLVVDPADRHRFRHQDGTPAFLLGYEADWLWALPLASPAARRAEHFLEKLKDAGFTQVSVNAFAHDTQWCPGKQQCGDQADDYGPAPGSPWPVTGGATEYSRLDLGFWHAFDRVVAHADALGLTVNIQFRSWNKGVSWPANRSPADDLYFDWIVARYAAYNVTWDFSKESFVTAAQDPAYIRDRLERVAARDPYRRPRTANHLDETWSGWAPARPWLDFYSMQTHARWHQETLEQRRVLGVPVLVAEYGYEHGPGGPGDVTFPGVAGSGNQGPEEMARRALEIITAGGYPGYYYARTAWDVLRPQDDPPGYQLFGRIARFVRSTSFWRLEPHDELASGAYLLADPGREYLVYPTGSQPALLTVSGAAAPLPVRWLNVSTGGEAPGPAVGNGTVTLAPPPGLGSGILLARVGPP